MRYSAFLLSLFLARSLASVHDAQKAPTGDSYLFNYYLPPRGTSTPWWPSWSPDGEWLAFSMQGSLWKIRVGESAAHEIAQGKEYLSSPEWSPDGRWFAYTADDGKSINLKLIDLESGKSTELTRGDGLNLDPAWAPDGSRLAYVSTRPNGRFNIFILEINRGKPGNLIQLTRDHSYGKNRLYFGEYDLHIQPTWSPSGKEIIFVSNRGIALGSGAIWRMPAEASGIDHARIVHKEETLYRTRPHWSPDGKRFIYSSHLGGQFTNLFLLPAEGGEPYKMTFGQWDSFHPRWSPNGEWIAYISNQEGLPQMRLLKTYGGLDRKVEIRSRRWLRPMGRLQVRVKDAVTGGPLAARIALKAADGKAYVPGDAYHRLGGSTGHFFHTSGSFSLEAPAGEIFLEARRGFEYYPEQAGFRISAERNTGVTLSLKRMTDLMASGWYSGGNHSHMNYGGNLHNTPENMVSMAEAEDLHVVTAMVANKDNRVMDFPHFTGRLHPLSSERRLLYFNEEYRPPFYGHMSLINLTRHLISPFTNGYEGTALASHYPSNTDVLRMAREQGALGAYVHPFQGDQDPLEGDLRHARTFPVDLALGTVDYLEISWPSRACYRVWHHALNSGFRIPLVGGEDSITDLQSAAILGEMRTYAQLGPKLTWGGWLSAIRTGRSFVTNGPLLELQVHGKLPGDEVQLPQGGGKVRVHGRVQSIVTLSQIQLVVSGKPLDIGEAPQEFTREIEFSESGWITLQAFGRSENQAQATTNPVWVQVGKRPLRSTRSAQYFIRWIDKLIPLVEALPGWRSPREKEHVVAQCREAKAVYERIADPRAPLAHIREPLPTVRARYYPAGSGAPLPADSPAWKPGFPVTFDRDWDGRAHHLEQTTTVTPLWNERHLYLLFESNYLTLHMEAKPDYSKDQWVFMRDCVEFFSVVDPARMSSYKELDFSPQGEWFDARFGYGSGKSGADVEWSSGFKIMSSIDSERKRWWVSVAIPMVSLSDRVEPGRKWRVNFYRIEGPPESGPQRLHLAWSPTFSVMPNFHAPSRFGWMEFVK